MELLSGLSELWRAMYTDTHVLHTITHTMTMTLHYIIQIPQHNKLALSNAKFPIPLGAIQGIVPEGNIRIL